MPTSAESHKIGAPESGELNRGRYKDPSFYIDHQRKDHHTEASLSVHNDAKSRLDSAVMDMMGEDQSGVMNSKRRYHWVGPTNLWMDTLKHLFSTFSSGGGLILCLH